MERLTNKQTSRCVSCGSNEECAFAAGEFSAPCPDYRRYQRLADIEDILGDDYDLNRLKELVQADREERCMVHPLKSDDEVYIILLSRVFLFEVTSAVWYRESPIYKAMHGIHFCYVFNQDDIGKTVFLTREEAEAALEKMKEDK